MPHPDKPLRFQTLALVRARRLIDRAIASGRAARQLRRLDRLGLLTRLFPELEAARGFPQPPEHYWDVLEHSIQVVQVLDSLIGSLTADSSSVATRHGSPIALEADRPGGLVASAAARARCRAYFGTPIIRTSRRALLKLAGLLHDVAKPATRTVQPNGRIRFFGHAALGADQTRTILGRLAYPDAELEWVASLVEGHLRPGQLCTAGPPTERAARRLFRDAGDGGIALLVLGLADHAAMEGPRLGLPAWAQHVERTAELFENLWRAEEPRSPKLLDGEEIMARFGLAPGPRVGLTLRRIRQAQEGGQITTREEAVALAERVLGGTATEEGN